MWSPTFWSEKKTRPFFHLSLDKAGPFTLESHSCVKALKCKVSRIIRCLIKLLLKNSIQTIFQGGTSWVAQLLKNIIVWMVLYCEHQLLGVEKKTKPFFHLSSGKAGPFTLQSHVCVKALKCKVFQVIFMPEKTMIGSVNQNKLFGWYSIVSTNFWEWKKNKTLFPPFFG